MNENCEVSRAFCFTAGARACVPYTTNWNVPKLIHSTVGIFFRLIYSAYILFYLFVAESVNSKYCISICIQPKLYRSLLLLLFRNSLQSADLNIGERISRRRKLDSLTVKSDNSILFFFAVHWCQVSHIYCWRCWKKKNRSSLFVGNIHRTLARWCAMHSICSTAYNQQPTNNKNKRETNRCA